MLASQVEEEICLAYIEREWAAEYQDKPRAIDLLRVLTERFCNAQLLLQTLSQYLEPPAGTGLAEKILHPDMRHAIDGHLEAGLVAAVAEAAGTSKNEAKDNIIGLSLDSRLIPWHILKNIRQFTSVAELRGILYSLERGNNGHRCLAEIERWFEQVKRDAEQAAKQLVGSNLRLVIGVAKKYVGCGLPFPGLIQEGNLGLIHAAEKFNHRKGYKFSTYATWWIRQAVTRAIAIQSHTIRLPLHITESIRKLGRVTNCLAQEFGHISSRAEIAPRDGCSTGESR